MNSPFFDLFQFGLKIERLSQRLEKESGLTLTQWSILKRLIDMPGGSMTELADSVGVQASTMTSALKRLRKKNYIYIGQDPNDSRKKNISVTKAGMTIFSSADKTLGHWVDQHPNLKKKTLYKPEMELIKVVYAVFGEESLFKSPSEHMNS